MFLMNERLLIDDTLGVVTLLEMDLELSSSHAQAAADGDTGTAQDGGDDNHVEYCANTSNGITAKSNKVAFTVVTDGEKTFISILAREALASTSGSCEAVCYTIGAIHGGV